MISRNLEAALLRASHLRKSFQLNEDFKGHHGSSLFSGTEVTTVAVLFDLSGFSERTRRMSGRQIDKLLAEYYNFAIPAIYMHGGVVEKLIGDGILAVFGPPFKPLHEGVLAAFMASMFTIVTGRQKGMPMKAALRIGRGYFARIGTEEYSEHSLVGPVLTEVFRLEDETVSDSIAVYEGTDEHALLRGMATLAKDRISITTYTKSVTLRGVLFDRVLLGKVAFK